jgi:hypothetical protein
MTVKDFLDVFRNPSVTVEIKDSADELVAKLYANGKDILNTEISGREIDEIKVENVSLVVVTVKDQP